MLYRDFFKRLMDLVLGSIGLVLSLPLFVPFTVLLALANDGYPFFFQKRPGKNNKIFKVIKFKTMNDKKDGRGKLLPDDQRLTKIGKFVRSTSLDEIPQLINVIKGDMSLIGPWPLLVKYLPLYSDRQSRRHEVRPGKTGWAQVNGRNAISWEQKFEYDVYYVDNLSFLLDLKILFLTIKKVLKREGISGQDTATMKPFQGNG